MANGSAPVTTNFYIDGFNLYYGSLKGTPYKWLDLSALCARLVPGGQVGQIRYFTARVDAGPTSAGQRTRQDTYIRALRTIPNLSIKEGHFLTKPSSQRLVQPVYGPDRNVPNPSNPMVSVWKSEEKGSDVNLATSLLLDAAAGRFDRAWVLSNDSDLAWPIAMVRREYRLPVSVYKPDRPANYRGKGRRPDSHHLVKAARKFKRIKEEDLAPSQFPTFLSDAGGRFRRPVRWDAT